jgi:hypothetical protein
LEAMGFGRIFRRWWPLHKEVPRPPSPYTGSQGPCSSPSRFTRGIPSRCCCTTSSSSPFSSDQRMSSQGSPSLALRKGWRLRG